MSWANTVILVMSSVESESSQWSFVPDPIFLHISRYLSVKDLLNASTCCKNWHQMAQDDYLWNKIFRRDFKIDQNIALRPGLCVLSEAA